MVDGNAKVTDRKIEMMDRTAQLMDRIIKVMAPSDSAIIAFVPT